MIKDIFLRTFKKTIDPFYAGGAAEVAFFLVLSIVPTTIILAQILDVFTMSMSAITNLLTEYLDSDIVAILTPMLSYRPSNALSVVLFVLALWSGSKALFSLMRMSNYAYKGGTGYKNPIFAYIRERARALITTIIILLTFVFALFVLVFGEEIIDIVLRYINGFLGNNMDFDNVWYALRWVIAFLLYLFMVLTVYYIMPLKKTTPFSRLIAPNIFRTAFNILVSWWANFRRNIKLILPGSILAALGMLLATWLYSFYIAWVSSDERNFNILYGGLSSIVLLLIWFYVLSFVLIIGVQLNAAWIEVSDERLTKKKVKLRERYHVKRNKQIAADKSEDDELPLVFGTAGMRGLMGEGKKRFNVMTVRRASQAFATHILEKAKDEGVTPSIVIAYDSRRDSDLFAYEAASVFAANEVKAYVFRSLSATPLLSFAVREIGATAGLVITASHNGKEYNGYKIYNSTGCQCLPDEAADVAGIIDEVDPASGIKTIADSYRGDASQRLIFATDHEEFLSIVPDYIESKYFDAVISTSQGNEGIENLSVVYTPLNGVGNLPVREVLKRLGVVNIALVNEQELPDSEFTTCPEPNPENPEALALGLSLCEKKKLEGNPPDLLIATDPDSDRLGVAAYHDGAYTILTGNQVGVLMLDYLIEKHKASGLPKGKPVVITSIVSTPLAAQIADSNGVEMQRVLTGFKNIGAAMNKLDSEGRISDFIFSYEESCGYLSGTYARDKDAINAAMLTCEIAALYKTQGKTFVDRIHEIEDIYGYVAEETVQFVHPGEQGMRNMEEMMRLARSQKVRESLGADLLEIKDYLDEEGELRSDVVEFDFSNHSKVLLRPSGTEPKVKAYFFTFGDTILEATTTLNDLKSTFIPCIEV